MNWADEGDEENNPCPILLFLGCANDAATSLLRLRQRLRSVQVSTSQYKSVQVPNAHF
ncbi:hypothetical protein [Nostoc sp.]